MNTPGLPEAFVQSMAEQLGDELPAFLACYQMPALRGIRINPLKPGMKTSRPEGLLEAVPWAGDGYYLAEDSQAGAHPLHEAGAWYIQEPSAMLPACVLAVKPGESVLDLCAAPGGKTAQLGAMLRGEGLLVSNEIVPARARILSRNVERMGIPNALVISASPDQLAARWEACFDAVLADAPCSGEGMFRRVPESRAEWQAQTPAGCAVRQAEILDAAARMVWPGGRLVYATCTFSRIENEDTVQRFLERHRDFALCAFSLPGAEAPGGMITCYPHRMPGEGQFAALMIRSGDAPARDMGADSLPHPDRQALRAFTAAFPDAPQPTGMMGGGLLRMPGCPDLNGLRVLRCGVRLGELRGSVFVPDHSWAVSAMPPAVPSVPLSGEEARRYQAGETLPAPDGLKGWVLPALDGLCLGWGKAGGGVMKNHYPKGLRRPWGGG